MKVDEGTQQINPNELKGRKVQLSIVEGPDHGNQFEIAKAQTVIGRAQRNDIVLQDRRVSANHASVEIQNGEILIKDLGSTNGTFVNNRQISTSRLQNLDEIVIGTTKILVSIFEDLNQFKMERTGKTSPLKSESDLLHDEASQSSKILADMPISAPGDPSQRHSKSSRVSKAGAKAAGGGETVSFLEINNMISEEIKEVPPPEISSKRVNAASEPLKAAALSKVACTLRLLKGPDCPKDFTLKKPTTTIGRRDCDLKLNDIDVSRKHMVLEVVMPDKIFIRDLGSTNGTFVNGKRVSYQQINNKDLIQCGQTLIEVSLENVDR